VKRILKRTLRLFFLLVLVLSGLALAVFLYYLPAPEPLKVREEVEYKEIVRSISFTDAGKLEEWEEKKFSSRSTVYSIEEEDGRGVLRALSEDSASGFYLKEKFSYKDRPYVKWHWKVARFPERKEPETLQSKAEFDFAAQFYVLFYSRSIMSTQGIQYVWTEEIPEGTTDRSPYTKNIKMLVLRKGTVGEWKTEERDICRDYLELFGKELDKDIAAIAFMTDSDSTGTVAEAYFADVEVGYLPKDKAEDATEGTDL
jgi:hypothetical protein